MTIGDAVRVRAQGEVDEDAPGYVRSKVDAAFDRLGLPPAEGPLTVVRAAAPHVRRPWSATARLLVAGSVVVVHAEETTAHELGDRLEDRVRARAQARADRTDTARRSAAPPPWRGGPAGPDEDTPSAT
ncbi:MAG: hypothetical protein JF597_07440 [Streptomyces sp.]|jgi:hypothetical protein|uniref:hypothetical protein n=1 Tax=Streptomyces sp. TaxID=1931 RepID=UPI0025EDE92B|nr:hypothetical protein [Streptomyces sp.]MBW8793416.1 hypothetical protein [Streptomyces sp.]